MNSKQRFRARAVLVLICLAAAALAAALYWTQLVKGESYAARANKQYVKPAVSLFDRGSIFFSSLDGTRLAAATVGRGFLIYMNPTLMTDAASAYESISHYMKIDRAEFMRKAAKKSDVYEELAHRVDEDVADAVTSLGIPGIGATRETWRAYPGEGLAAHALGLMGESPDGTVEGRYGLERFYEQTLKRTSSDSSVNIFAGLFGGLRDTVFGSSAGKSGDIVTTIEPTVQGYLKDVLTKASKTWKPDEIGGIIMDPSTGEIAAMASLPDFDAEDLSNIKDVSILSNPLVEHVYELGSIMKPLTMAVGLDSGVFTPSSTYNDTGTMTLNGKRIANFDGRARGITPMQEVLSQSLNIGAATIALKVGKDEFARYFRAFGFADKTGIDLPSEAASIIGNLESGRDIEIATAAYGQGIAISPIAMTRALAILANGGYLVRPHVTKEIDYTDGTVEKIAPEKTGPVISEKTAGEVRDMLIKVVDTALKNGNVKMEHYTMAAKTGTAQIPDHTNGGYYGDRYLHSFFGFFPAYKPRFIVFLYQIHPKGATYASETLTDPYIDLAKFLITYYDIEPDR